jgi:hypothetical protein
VIRTKLLPLFCVLPGCVNLPPDPGVPSSKTSQLIAFDQAFKISELVCRSQGQSSVEVKLPPPKYQFGDCTFSLERLDSSVQPVTITVVGKDEPGAPVWSVTNDQGVFRIQQTRDTLSFLDWSDRPVELRFDYVTAAGKQAWSQLELTPAPMADVVGFQLPRVATTELVRDFDGSWLQLDARVTADGTPVFRRDESPTLELPFHPAKDSTLHSLAAEAWLDGLSDCPLADRAFHMSIFGWTPSDNPAALRIAAAKLRGDPCDVDPTPGILEGKIHFSMPPALPPVERPFRYRVVASELKDDVAIDVRRSADGGIDLITVKNNADYSLREPLVVLDARCADNGVEFSFSFGRTLAAASALGIREVANLPPGATLQVSGADLHDGIVKRAQAAKLVCASQKWSSVELSIEEFGRGYWNVPVPLTPPAVVDAN